MELMEEIYKNIDGRNLEYTKLLWEKVGNKRLLSEFGRINLKSYMYFKTHYNKTTLVNIVKVTAMKVLHDT